MNTQRAEAEAGASRKSTSLVTFSSCLLDFWKIVFFIQVGFCLTDFWQMGLFPKGSVQSTGGPKTLTFYVLLMQI